MKLRYFVAIIGFLTTTLIYSQDKQITLEDIWSGAFRTEGMQALHSMNNGNTVFRIKLQQAKRYSYHRYLRLQNFRKSKDLSVF